jgi:hypothetical protein
MTRPTNHHAVRRRDITSAGIIIATGGGMKKTAQTTRSGPADGEDLLLAIARGVLGDTTRKMKTDTGSEGAVRHGLSLGRERRGILEIIIDGEIQADPALPGGHDETKTTVVRATVATTVIVGTKKSGMGIQATDEIGTSTMETGDQDITTATGLAGDTLETGMTTMETGGQDTTMVRGLTAGLHGTVKMRRRNEPGSLQPCKKQLRISIRIVIVVLQH